MINIGNFFFKYRNNLFIFLYLTLFVPSPALFSEQVFGHHYYLLPIILGLCITLSGEAIRAATIGLAYIIRGGKDKKVYAETLVTEGIFNHCRNPLYVGNILMLMGMGILVNSLLYTVIVMPVFLFIYQAIVLAEEHFLHNKFGAQYMAYCQKAHRWIPNFRGLSHTFSQMRFNASRWVYKEYNTLFIWLTGIVLILLFKYPQLTQHDRQTQYVILCISLVVLSAAYLTIRYYKKVVHRNRVGA